MADPVELRRSLLAFSVAIACALTDWQARAVQGAKRILCIVAPRQSGKSRTLAVFALWRAFRTAGTRVLIVSASEDAARRLLAEVRRLATASPLLAGSVTEEFAGLVKLSNGSEIRSVPASERQIRGWAVDVLLVDEAALVPDDLLIGAAFPTIAAREHGKIILASSATSASGAFFDHVAQGEAGSEFIESHRWRLADAVWLTPSVVQAMRESMSPLRFAAEMEGMFASGQDALFTRAGLEAVTFDYPQWTLASLVGPARPIAGVDWGAVSDHSAVTVLGRNPGEASLRVLLAHAWPSGEPLHNVVTQLTESPARWGLLSLERNGLGEPLTQEVVRLVHQRQEAEQPRQRGWVEGPPPTYKRPRRRPTDTRAHRPWRPVLRGVTTTAALKAATFSALRLLVDREQIEFPASATDLLRELLLLRVDLSPGGDERIAASGAAHDDLAMSLALALGPYRRTDGRWVTLADHAIRQPVPPPRRDATDDPWAFQSVVGPEITSRNPITKPTPVELGGFFVYPGGIR